MGFPLFISSTSLELALHQLAQLWIANQFVSPGPAALLGSGQIGALG
jgi:hypothetical protein